MFDPYRNKFIGLMHDFESMWDVHLNGISVAKYLLYITSDNIGSVY